MLKDENGFILDVFTKQDVTIILSIAIGTKKNTTFEKSSIRATSEKQEKKQNQNPHNKMNENREEAEQSLSFNGNSNSFALVVSIGIGSEVGFNGLEEV